MVKNSIPIHGDIVTTSCQDAHRHIVVEFLRNAKLVWLSIFADLGGVTSMATSGREDGKRRDFLLGQIYRRNLCRWSTHVV